MSTHITPRPRSASASASRAHTRPAHSHPSPSSPFRWSSQRPIPHAPSARVALANVHLAPCARGATAIHVRVCSLDTGHTEVAVIVATAARTFALALRLEEYRGRWMATALELA